MLQHEFITNAKAHPDKIAIVDKTTGTDLSYGRALLASLILSRRFRKLERGRIGIMLPTGSGAALAVVGSLMAGLTPVMINYSSAFVGQYYVKNPRYVLRKREVPALLAIFFQ